MRRITALFFALALVGCDHNEKDSHTEVFKTPQEVLADRRAKQLVAHKELAISVLHFSRADVVAKPADDTAINVSADGVSHSIDILPIEEQLVKNAAEERAILRRYLDGQLRSFDTDRVKSLGFDKVKKDLTFDLVNPTALKEIQKNTGESAVQSNSVVSNVLRVTIIRRGEPASTVPVSAALLEAWKITAATADEAAMQNLRDSLSRAGDSFMETIVFGTAGNSGSLKSATDPAVILLPEFLTAVQKTWKTRDNLVLFVPSTTGIVFVEEHNQRLLDTLAPQWKKQLAALPSALSGQFLLRDAEKISAFAYSPATKPATVPATKPSPYFVH